LITAFIKKVLLFIVQEKLIDYLVNLINDNSSGRSAISA